MGMIRIDSNRFAKWQASCVRRRGFGPATKPVRPGTCATGNAHTSVWMPVASPLVRVKAGTGSGRVAADAEKLARWYMAGDVTPAWVSDEAHEALCDVVRAREAAKNDRDRTRH